MKESSIQFHALSSRVRNKNVNFFLLGMEEEEEA
jgi:hypothetical protein